MEAKKNGRITIKSLSETFQNQVNNLKETVTNWGNRLEESEKKCQEEKFANLYSFPKNVQGHI